MKQKIIYALKCPIKGSIHYIGKSNVGLTRPFSHLKESHSEKIKEWVEDLRLINNKPDISILEYVDENISIDSRERYWINHYLNEGSYLLNSILVSPSIINPNLEYVLSNNKANDILVIAEAIKKRRKDLRLSQSELASKAGIALTVIRKIEQGKENFTFESLVSLMSLLGLGLYVKKN
jgi:DNA-binding XRE family transcriptional regulator